MFKAFQLMNSSSGLVSSSPLKKWVPLWQNDLSFLNHSTRSSSSSSRAAPRILFPAVSSSRGSGFLRSFRISATRLDSSADDSSSKPFSPTLQSMAHMRKVSFCQSCGSATKQAIPDGDDKTRIVCTACGKVAYQNPKMVVGCLVEHDSKILLCKRKIQPAYGLWTLPSGYMEIGESAADGAARETREEAGAEVKVLSPFAQLDIPYIGNSYIFFRAKMTKLQFSPGPESLDCRLFAPDDIPFDSLAFSSMLVALKLYIEDLKAGQTMFHYCTINKSPGSGPSDIRAYTLGTHLQSHLQSSTL